MHQGMRRWIFFILMIALGLGAGLAFGWEVWPLAHRDASPDTLDRAYQTDFVLMTAELYHSDGDLVLAQARLAYLGEQDPLALLDTALAYAEVHQYAPGDLQLMRTLAEAIALSETEGT